MISTLYLIIRTLFVLFCTLVSIPLFPLRVAWDIAGSQAHLMFSEIAREQDERNNNRPQGSAS